MKNLDYGSVAIVQIFKIQSNMVTISALLYLKLIGLVGRLDYASVQNDCFFSAIDRDRLRFYDILLVNRFITSVPKKHFCNGNVVNSARRNQSKTFEETDFC